jgi:hypothetical protein
MDIAGFYDLLTAARQQPDPQRLLFVFAASDVAPDALQAQKDRYESGDGGELTPVLCVDKRPDELTTFAALVEESRNTDKDWRVVFVAAITDYAPTEPDRKRVDGVFDQIMRMIQAGTLGPLLAFDRSGDPLMFKAA